VRWNISRLREQGYDVTWPIIRGVYMSPGISDSEYQYWVSQFEKAMENPAFTEQRKAMGLYPFSMTGKALTDYVMQTVERYRVQAKELGMVR
jgi:putative tricarboxylic transport membrane protein